MPGEGRQLIPEHLTSSRSDNDLPPDVSTRNRARPGSLCWAAFFGQELGRRIVFPEAPNRSDVVLSSLLISVFVLAIQTPEPQAVPSRIDRVTVYSGQALVERAFTVSADAPGSRTFVVAPLPLTADDSSFQAKLLSGPLVVQGLEMRRRSGELEGSDRDRVRARLRELRQDLRALESTRLAIDEGRSVLGAAVKSLEQRETLSAADLEFLLQFVTRESEKLDQDLIRYEQQRDRVRQEIQDLEQQLGGGGGQARQYQEARVTVFFERAGEAQMALSYLSRGASWAPAYDVRLDTDLTRVDVGLVGEVRQATDEDWSDVELWLSTARPHVGLDPPEVPRRVVRIPTAARRGRYRGEVDARAPLQELGYAGDEGKALADFAKAPEVAVEDFGITQQFRLPDRVTVVSNREPKQFQLVRVPLDVEPERYIIPSLSEEAYLRAEVTSTGETPLLPGTAKVYLGPDFLGKASFPMLLPGDSTMLNLGIDPNLTVQYEELRDERDDPGFLSDTVRLHRMFRAKLSLSAAAAREITVLVEEVIPVSQDDRVEIKPIDPFPAPLRTDEDLKDREEKGIYRWKLTMKPGQDAVVRWGYSAAFDEDLSPVFTEG